MKPHKSQPDCPVALSPAGEVFRAQFILMITEGPWLNLIKQRLGTTERTISPWMLKNDTLKIHPGYPHDMMTTNADVINADILAFI